MGEEKIGVLGIASLSSDPSGRYCAREIIQMPGSRLRLHSGTLCFLPLFVLSLLRQHLSTSVHLGVGACISQSKSSLEEGTVSRALRAPEDERSQERHQFSCILQHCWRKPVLTKVSVLKDSNAGVVLAGLLKSPPKEVLL